MIKKLESILIISELALGELKKRNDVSPSEKIHFTSNHADDRGVTTELRGLGWGDGIGPGRGLIYGFLCPVATFCCICVSTRCKFPVRRNHQQTNR